jgi:alpha-mannosidase
LRIAGIADCRLPIADCPDSGSGQSQIANQKSQIRSIANRRFTYSLYPHPEDWSRGGTTRQAYQLNYPLLVRREPAHVGDLSASHSFVSVDADHVIIETIKRAEDDESWIVRVYDYANRRGPVTLTFCEPIARAAECNLVERDERSLKPRGRTLEFEIRPYEVKTFKVRLA